MKGINNMTLREHVNQFGKDSDGGECTPLMVAAWGEHFQVVKYLIEQGEADPNIANIDGDNALHWAAYHNSTNTELIELLMTHMYLDSINKKDGEGCTPLDDAYGHNNSPIQQEITALLRSKGGKANCYDANGRDVGKGNGDLNVGRHAVITGSDIEVVREALTKIDDINEVIYEETVLDLAYYQYNNSPIKQEIIDLLRSKGGKANCYDANGSLVGEGNGDLND
jgi:ankyrin repeat protein